MKVTFIFDIHVKKYKGKLPPTSWAPLKAAVSQQYNSAKALESHLIYARSTSYWYFSHFMLLPIGYSEVLIPKSIELSSINCVYTKGQGPV